VVLVGHSYGEAIITEACNDSKVSPFVHIAALALDDGDSCASIEQALSHMSHPKETATLTEEAAAGANQ
jgi:hypothetical protein